MTLPRRLLADYFGNDPRLVKAFEDQAEELATVTDAVSTAAQATETLKDATVIVLSANGEFTNERQLQATNGISARDAGGKLRLSVDKTVVRCEGGAAAFVIPGSDTWFLPFGGTLITRDSRDTLSNKTLAAPKLSGLVDAADDATAAAAGVAVGGMYHASGALRVRLA